MKKEINKDNLEEVNGGGFVYDIDEKGGICTECGCHSKTLIVYGNERFCLFCAAKNHIINN